MSDIEAQMIRIEKHLADIVEILGYVEDRIDALYFDPPVSLHDKMVRRKLWEEDEKS